MRLPEAARQLWTKLWFWRAGRRLWATLDAAAGGNPVRRRVHALYEAASTRGLAALTARQRLVVTTWNARGIIGSGGFRHFLEGDLSLLPVAEGFRALGFEAAALACERVMAAVKAAPGLTEEARRAAVRAGAAGAFEAEESAVFEVGGRALERAMGDFMRRHPRDFPGLPPAPAAAAEPDPGL